MSGRLLVCATPIGNLGDVTLRVLDALREANTILAEDTRVSRKLLARYEITTSLERYDAHSVSRRTPEVVDRIAAGELIALVSDAGTPGVSDPGAVLVDACIEAGVAVEVLPGASAIITALVASGLPTHAFYFGGFLPRKAGDLRRQLQTLAPLDATLVFYESPRRAAATLAAIAEVMPKRKAALARELTKLYEEVVRAPIAELAYEIAGRAELKGEVVLLVGPPTGDESPPVDAEAVRARIAELVSAGAKRSEAVKQVAAETGVPRNEVYDLGHGA